MSGIGAAVIRAPVLHRPSVKFEPVVRRCIEQAHWLSPKMLVVCSGEIQRKMWPRPSHRGGFALDGCFLARRAESPDWSEIHATERSPGVIPWPRHRRRDCGWLGSARVQQVQMAKRVTRLSLNFPSGLPDRMLDLLAEIAVAQSCLCSFGPALTGRAALARTPASSPGAAAIGDQGCHAI
jgi:hypothetical protein